MAWAVLLVWLGGTAPGRAQTEAAGVPRTDAPQWRLVVDGTEVDWPENHPTAPLDRVREGSRRVLKQLRRAGHYYARLDSATVDTTTTPPRVQLHVHRGPRVRVDTVSVTGAEAVPPDEVRRLVGVEAGEPLRPDRLEADIQAVLDRYETAGHPLAEVHIERTTVTASAPPRLHLTLRIEEGPSLWLKRVTVPENTRTDPALIAHLADLTVGAPLTDYDPGRIRRALAEHPLFDAVDPPEVRVGADGGALLRVPVEEAAPGAFDVVLGYLPSSGPRGGGQLVGRGHLTLNNLFGGARRAELQLDRRPGRASIFDLSVADPYVAGRPFRLEGRFRGEQRDSTYGERRYRLEAGYRFGGGLEVEGSVSREVVAPGPAGSRLREGRQRIARSRTWFYGVGLRFERLDRRVNPRRGLTLDLHVEQGRERRRRRKVVAGDTLRVRRSGRQERLRGHGRGYLSLTPRQVLVLGGDGRLLLSDRYDRSDLFRFGGAASLRGYDEDRFLGTATARGVLEYRLLLDRRSYAYAFGDVGYVYRPALRRSDAGRGWHPGYGVGVQLDTAIGRITTTYALNPTVASPADGRIHFGLSVGL